jgi:hypothetical protein
MASNTHLHISVVNASFKYISPIPPIAFWTQQFTQLTLA